MKQQKPYIKLGILLSETRRYYCPITTQAHIAKLLGIPRGEYSNMENGYRRMPLHKLRRFFTTTQCSDGARMELVEAAILAELRGAGFDVQCATVILGSYK